MTGHVPDSKMGAAGGAAPPALPRRRVALLMGTFQGARFLPQQLDSIANQTYSNWALWVSDDRSSDGTLGILDTYRARWGADRMAVRTGPAQGFRANFLSLACDSAIDAHYFAFADQDDLWDAAKLEVAVRWLATIPADVPALYCARTRLIDEHDRAIGYSPLFPKPFAFRNALVQSGAGGNTMVFNAAARALLVEAGADVILQTHDWWTYILVTGCGGRVYYDAIPKVGYRQHDRNMVGSNASWNGRWRRLRRILIGDFAAMNDCNIAALQRVRHRLSAESLRVLDQFSRARGRSLFARVAGMRHSGVYCQTALSSIALAGAILMNRI
jgi:glycosyltransferase involved in cell wall biosynthesis